MYKVNFSSLFHFPTNISIIYSADKSSTRIVLPLKFFELNKRAKLATR